MVRRQLRGRGIHDERVLGAMSEVPRELFLAPELRKRAYRDGAIRIGESQTMSQPWIVACMAQALELKGDERVLEVGTGSGYAAAVLSRLCAELVTIERFESLAREASARLGELGYGNVEVRHGDGTRGAPDRAPFQGISVTAAASGGPPPALLDQLAPGGTLVCPVERGHRELLLSVRDGVELPLADVRFVPLVQGEDVEREFSAGGVVLRDFDGRPHVVVLRVRGDLVTLPKGHPDGDETPVEAATREVREETGVEAEPLEKLGDVRYTYRRGGRDVSKVVSFFLFRWRSGSVSDHDSEAEEATWIPLEDAPAALTHSGEREMALAALSRVANER